MLNARVVRSVGLRYNISCDKAVMMHAYAEVAPLYEMSHEIRHDLIQSRSSQNMYNAYISFQGGFSSIADCSTSGLAFAVVSQKAKRSV